MTRGVGLYFVGSIVLVSLAGCGRGFFQAEREPWRAEAEVACLKSGAVKESADLVRIEPISGPGVCGADYPLKVAALGDASSSFGFADESLRPPAPVGNQPRWPLTQPQNQTYPNAASYPRTDYPEAAVRQPSGYGASSGPISLSAPGVPPQEDEIDLPPDGADPAAVERYMNAPSYPARQGSRQGSQQGSSSPYSPRQDSQRREMQPLPRLGPLQGNPVAAVGLVAVRPTATLACPIVSALDRWLSDTVQPAATRWFGQRVVEIKQISAYSCRSRNGDGTSRISEHAFGNALDVAGFVLADGRTITVENGWHGLPEEQGFLRDIEAGACYLFTTVLAPGSNAAHYNHIHVDLRRRSGRDICSPQAVSGEEIAARAHGRLAGRQSSDPAYTGSLAQRARQRGWFAAEDDD